MKILHLNGSIRGAGSVLRELSALIVQRIAATVKAEVVYHDLVAEDRPRLAAATVPTAHPISANASSFDTKGVAIRDMSDRTLKEFITAETVVIGVPMYNFTALTQLKTWIDCVVIPGKTFRYGANAPEGLMWGKRVVLPLACGGFYGRETAVTSSEHVESYLRAVFGFMGITTKFILAEGLASGEHNKAQALTSARDASGQLAA